MVLDTFQTCTSWTSRTNLVQGVPVEWRAIGLKANEPSLQGELQSPQRQQPPARMLGAFSLYPSP